MVRRLAVAGILCCVALAAAQQPTSQTASAPASQAASVPASRATSVPSSRAASVPASQATSVPSSRAASVPASQAASAPWPSSASAPAEPTQADLLAADSLRHSAMSMIYARWGTRGRAGRLVALATYAQKLDPGNIQTAWVLSNIYESRGQAADAEEMMWRRFLEDPNDFDLGVRYLRMGLAARAKPDEQQTFLQTVADNAALPETLRAQAIVEQARMFMANKERDQARQQYMRAATGSVPPGGVARCHQYHRSPTVSGGQGRNAGEHDSGQPARSRPGQRPGLLADGFGPA